MKSWLIGIVQNAGSRICSIATVCIFATAGLTALDTWAASAMPIGNLAAAAPRSVANARLLCTPSGRCYRTYRRYRVVRHYHAGYNELLAPATMFEPDYSYHYGLRFAPVYGYVRPYAFGAGYYAAEVYDGCGPYTCGPAYSYTYSAAYGYAPTYWTGSTIGVGFGF